MAQFINCKKAVEIDDGDNKVMFPAGYIGEVPAWAEKHWYYKALCKDGTITSVVKTKDKTPEELEAEEAAKKANAEKAAEKKRMIDEAKAEAKANAEKQAADQGLDEAAAKKLIAEAQTYAEEAALAKLSADTGKN